MLTNIYKCMCKLNNYCFKDHIMLLKKIANYISVLLVIILIFTSCGKDQPTAPEEVDLTNVKVSLSSYPNIGSNNTFFEFYVKIEPNANHLKEIRFDLNGDNVVDTVQISDDTLKTKLKNLGLNEVKSTIVFTDNSTLSSSIKVWVSQPKIILKDGRPFFEPNIYNGKMISVTHGTTHQAQLINIDTYEINCYLCDLNLDKFSEMHVTIPSFDGSKLLFDNGVSHDFCYTDITAKDTTSIDVPIDLVQYPVGKLTWSLDSKNIYGILRNTSDGNSGITSYNIETKEVKNIYSKGNYICVIPDQNDKLAILEKDDSGKHKLIIYNLKTNSIETQYSDIPLAAPFRIIKNSDLIYFDGKLAFYSLSKKQIYYMQFDELNLADHMYGEADINMEGNKFIIGTWDANRALYEIDLSLSAFQE